MLISELAGRTGVSPRALRHYEDRGLLTPGRDTNGYRVYDEADVVRVAQITTMIAAGLTTDVIHRYVSCARDGDHGLTLEMCPDLLAELDGLAQRLDAQADAIRTTRERLRSLACLP